MRTVSIAAAAGAANTVTDTAYLVELAFSTALRLSSRGDQSWNGQIWTGGRIKRVTGLQADNNGGQSGSIELINTDLAFSALILTEGAADRVCRVWEFHGNNPALEDTVQIFRGVMNDTDIGPDNVKIGLVREGAGTLNSPRRFIGPGTGFNHLRPPGTRITWGGQTYILERST